MAHISHKCLTNISHIVIIAPSIGKRLQYSSRSTISFHVRVYHYCCLLFLITVASYMQNTLSDYSYRLLIVIDHSTPPCFAISLAMFSFRCMSACVWEEEGSNKRPIISHGKGGKRRNETDEKRMMMIEKESQSLRDRKRMVDNTRTHCDTSLR